MRSACQPDTVRQEPPAPTDSPRSAEPREQQASAEQPLAAVKDVSLLRPHGTSALDVVRIRLLCCLRSVPARLCHTLTFARPLTDNDWQLLLQKTEEFADIEITYGYYWRDRFSGVLPAGYDASSVAAEAVNEVFTEQKETGLPFNPLLLKKDLKKRARKIINRLYHRMENRIMRNTVELPPYVTDDGERISVTELVPAPDPTPLEIYLKKEDADRYKEFVAKIRILLRQEGLVLSLFDCFCAGIWKPKDQARKLKRAVRDIQKLQRRLRRKLAAHGYVPASAKSKSRANYF